MEKHCYCTIYLEPRSRLFPTRTPKHYVSSAEIVGGDIVIHLTDDVPALVPYGLAKGAAMVLGRCSNCPPGTFVALEAPSGLFYSSATFYPEYSVSDPRNTPSDPVERSAGDGTELDERQNAPSPAQDWQVVSGCDAGDTSPVSKKPTDGVQPDRGTGPKEVDLPGFPKGSPFGASIRQTSSQEVTGNE